MYKYPGVYIEHVPSGLLAVEAASTSVAAFVGPVPRGPVGEPVFITSPTQFAQIFGDPGDTGGGIRNLGEHPDRFAHAVNAFFANGGSKAYVMRVAETAGAGAPAAADATMPNPADAARGFLLTATSPGQWANGLVAQLRTTDDGPDPDLDLGYTLEIGIPDADDALIVLESFDGLSMDSNSPRFIDRVASDGSLLLRIAGAPVGTGAAEIVVQANALRSGAIDTAAPLALTGQTLTLRVGPAASGNVEIAFDADSDDLDAIAAIIEARMRSASNGVPGFTATVVALGGGGSGLLLSSGGIGPDGDVTARGSEAAGSARALLQLADAASEAVPIPPGTLSNGADRITTRLGGGADGSATPGTARYAAAFETLRDYRDISIVLLPTLAWQPGGDNGPYDVALTHCEFMQNRLLLIDPPEPVGSARLTTPKSVKDLGAPTSPYAVLYYPWLQIANPFYDPDTAGNLPRRFAVGPSPHAAGMWARIDGSRGVWKAPAGLEATVRGAMGPTLLIGNELQGNLNEWGVNCLRQIIGPTVIWGARTLATKSQPEFRYVPVRRTQSMIGESLYIALQAVVFEPNDHRLWASLRAAATDFMTGLFRAGAFQGEKTSDAFFVQCGLGSTMTQGDIDAGIVRLVVGFAPLKPAEFVVVQIKQKVGRAA